MNTYNDAAPQSMAEISVAPHTASSISLKCERGLTTEEAQVQLEVDGLNTLHETAAPLSVVHLFVSFLWGPIPWVVEIAAVLSAILQNWGDLIIIALLLLVNAMVGVWQEHHAGLAVTALKARLAPACRVLRSGLWVVLPAQQLVVGDYVRMKLGDVVPADLNLVGDGFIWLDESALTGESLPVERTSGHQANATSIVVRGSMHGTVVQTGSRTLIGQTANLMGGTFKPSHFEQAMLAVGKALLLSSLTLSGLGFTIGLFRHEPVLQLLTFFLTLLVAAIPVALPLVMSVTLAVGASKLASRGAVVTRLVAVEELAGVDLLLCDKTGTLTQNRILVDGIWPASSSVHVLSDQQVVDAAAWTCELQQPDPIDQAVLAYQVEVGRVVLPAASVSLDEFDPISKRAIATVTHSDGSVQVVVKGAVQSVLEKVSVSESILKQIENATSVFASRGSRVVAVASTVPASDPGDLRFLGLMSFSDPLRPETRSTVSEAQRLGLRVQIVTGDHADIASHVAQECGLEKTILLGTDVMSMGGVNPEALHRLQSCGGFAQLLPSHKHRVVEIMQNAEMIVAVMGDGVNDIPALKQADVGIAVHPSSDAARATADLVLVESGIGVLVQAVQLSRVIFQRMNNYVVFRVTESVRILLFTTLIFIILGETPLSPAGVVILALLNDFPIMAISIDNVQVANGPIRWEMSSMLIMSGTLGLIGVFSSSIFYWLAAHELGWDGAELQTLVFLKLLVAGHLTLFVVRAPKGSWPWSRPFPDWRLFLALELTQLTGTFLAVQGWFLAPISLQSAVWVWVYSLAWMIFTMVVKKLMGTTFHLTPWAHAWLSRIHHRTHRVLWW